MKINSVDILNFRGIRAAPFADLGPLVVLAGQNGSGKSCVLDALRLLKSVYGGYQPNEFNQWFGEFQINLTNDPAAFIRLLNDKTKTLRIGMEIRLDDDERKYLSQEAESLVRHTVWRTIAPDMHGWSTIQSAPLAAQYRNKEGEVEEKTRYELELLQQELGSETIKGILQYEPGQFPKFEPSKVLELIFSFYKPQHIGVIDYHGPHRLYGREQINNINVNLTAIEERNRNSILYNYNQKYLNVKSEMAGLYVREALAEKAGVKLSDNGNMTETLKELFLTFFPEKEFLGPRPTGDGTLDFPVKIGGESSHDLDELSSGEKEILYGYLRLRSSARKKSVILLDEPELHLNPRLTRKLPEFYYRHLANPLNNQVWLVTHSDAILRESVGHSSYSVFHMVPSRAEKETSNQAQLITGKEDLERAIIDLV